MRYLILVIFLVGCNQFHTTEREHSSEEKKQATEEQKQKAENSTKGYDINGVLRECPDYQGPPAAPRPTDEYFKYSEQCVAKGFQSSYCQSIRELGGIFLCSSKVNFTPDQNTF